MNEVDLLDKLCDELDNIGIEGNVIERDIQKGCRNCKHYSKLITEEPCMDCDPRTDSPKNHWEAEDEID